MRKIIFVLTGLSAIGGLGVMAQQGDPITQRQSLMKNNQKQVRLLTGMSRGQTPFDETRAQAVF
jgi:cytochrome c556